MTLKMPSLRKKVVSAAPPFLLNVALRTLSGVNNLRRGLRGVRQVALDDNRADVHVLIIGPGEKTIPVSGWGAVELVIANQVKDLKSFGFRVDLLNSWNMVDWIRCFARKPQVVICHYDIFAFRARTLSRWVGAKCVTLTHYAYAQQPTRWDSQFGRYARNISKSDVFVALNEAIAEVFSTKYPNLEIVVIPNGVDVSRISSVGEHEGAICLGKVEPRKRQVDIARQLTGDENIRFVGEVVDPSFESLTSKQQSLFLGPWTRDQVESSLAKFSSLFLLGDGEADALVLYEAQTAGLEILTNAASVGAQNRNLAWISVVASEDEICALLSTIEENKTRTSPAAIASYASTNYGSAQSNSKYAELVRSLICQA